VICQLWAEIKLHQMLSHPHIVGFEDCFEDEENVYMILELCQNGVSHPCKYPSSSSPDRLDGMGGDMQLMSFCRA